MKRKNILMASMYALFIMSSQSCSKDDDRSIDRCDNCKPQQQTGKEKEKGKGLVSIIFDNYLGDQKMEMNDNKFDYKCSSAEGHAALKKITAFDYIVSNFILKNETGDSLIYPKEKSYFIISEEGQDHEVPHYGKYQQRPTPKELDEPTGEKNTTIDLDSIAAGKYTSMSFIIGVDTDCGDWGTDGPDWAEEFFKKCATYGLDWMWMVAPQNRIFKNVRFEGEFLNQGDTANTEFAIHIIDYMTGRGSAKRTEKVAYRKINIKFPKDKPLIVDEGSKGKINLHIDAGKLFNGSKKTNKIASSIMGGLGSINLADNFQEMFTVESVESE